jgi:hypothetical protein
MKPRERVRPALDHKEPDRIPIDLEATGETFGLHILLDEIRRLRGLHCKDAAKDLTGFGKPVRSFAVQ